MSLHPLNAPLGARALTAAAIGLFASLAVASGLASLLGAGGPDLLKTGVAFALVMVPALLFLGGRHPYPQFGPANAITTARAALVAVVAGTVGEPVLPTTALMIAAVSLSITLLDGADGWFARRTRMSSEFGARFDMEVDALLILALAVLAWQYDKAGVWVIASGLLRYGFVLGGWVLPWLAAPLPPTTASSGLRGADRGADPHHDAVGDEADQRAPRGLRARGAHVVVRH